MEFIQEISNSLALFSYKIALNFFKTNSRNTVFSPYSLFLALFLNSAINPDVSSRILKNLNFPNVEIPPGDQIKQLRYFMKSVETVPPNLKPINSTSFNQFISKYNFSDDQQYILYSLLKRTIKRTESKEYSINKEKAIEEFIKKIDYKSGSESNETEYFQRIVEGNIFKYPIIIGSNYLFTNQHFNLTIPKIVLKKYRNFIIRTEFPNPGHQVINELVNKTTRGMISNFVREEDLPSTTLYFIANSLYFKSFWKHQFVATPNTEVFHTISNEEKRIIYLKGKSQYKHYENDEFVYISIPYFKSSFCYEIIMPKEIDKFDNIKNKIFDHETLNEISTKSTKKRVSLKMPKFKIQSEINNIQQLMNIKGIETIFQKAVINVDELGTEASASTGIIDRSIDIEQVKEIFIDQPFLFLIRDKFNNLPLFIGEFTNPDEQ